MPGFMSHDIRLTALHTAVGFTVQRLSAMRLMSPHVQNPYTGCPFVAGMFACVIDMGVPNRLPF